MGALETHPASFGHSRAITPTNRIVRVWYRGGRRPLVCWCFVRLSTKLTCFPQMCVLEQIVFIVYMFSTVGSGLLALGLPDRAALRDDPLEASEVSLDLH